MIPLLSDPAEFAASVQRLFAERLLQQQAVSPRTVAAYRDTFQLLRGYAERQLGKPPAMLTLEDVDVELIIGLLASWLTSKPSATLEQQARRGMRVVDHLHRPRSQPVLLKQMTELENRSFIGYRLLKQFQPGKAAHRLNLVVRILYRRVRAGHTLCCMK